MVYVFLANGFEEIEAITPVDIMRRAGLSVLTVAVGSGGGRVVTGSHGIPVTADIGIDGVRVADMEAVVLPGGQPGTDNLSASADVRRAVMAAYEKGAVIGAICAAPSIFGSLGLLEGRHAVSFSAYTGELKGAVVENAPVVVDGKIVTAKAAGFALDFGHALVASILGKDKADDTVDRARDGYRA